MVCIVACGRLAPVPYEFAKHLEQVHTYIQLATYVRDAAEE
jgi:hypothetical protein